MRPEGSGPLDEMVSPAPVSRRSLQARVAGIVPQFGRFALVGASGVAVNLRFMLVSLAAYACQVAGFAAGLAHHLGRAASQLIAIACVMPINFLANRYWSFR